MKQSLKFNGMKELKSEKVIMPVDERMLNSIIAFIYKDSVLRTRKALHNIYRLFNLVIDDKSFENKPIAQDKVWIIKRSLESILFQGFTNNESIQLACLEGAEFPSRISDILDQLDTFKISYEESKSLVKQIEDRCRFGYVATIKSHVQRVFENIDIGEFRSYEEVKEVLDDIAISIINDKRDVSNVYSEDTLSLIESEFEDAVDKAMTKLKDKSNLFVTGIRRLNTILGGGYYGTRLYTYLAFPGGGKSQILLKAALDIKKYNSHVDTKDPDKIPTIVYLTMENDVTETVERIFNMCGFNDDIRNYTTKQVVRMLRKDGGLQITTDNKIDIRIMFRPNRSIDTNDLYSIVQDLEDRGAECIALILDYVKRIKPAEKAGTEKEELKNITNELKTFAKHFECPVITAQQLNRTAASVIDAAIQAKKEDVTKLIGRDGIAGAWEIIENSDVVILLNQEQKRDTGEIYMTFKLLKRRYRTTETNEKLKKLDYFNHPYEKDNTICLIDDIDSPKSISLVSLSTEFVAADPNIKKRNKRENMVADAGARALDTVPNSIYEPFDMDVQKQF